MMEFEIKDTIRDTSKMKAYLKAEWCSCKDDSEFLCFVEDGCCSCGVQKHHVHCKKCGGITQVG